MKCVYCGKETNEGWGLKISLIGLKRVHLNFCTECVLRIDIFIDSIPLTVITDQKTAILKTPIPSFTDLFYQYLKTARVKMSYDQFTCLPCTCCHQENIKISLESFVRGAAVLLVFCEACATEPNIFLDHTPFTVFKDFPQAVLYMTPNFNHYLHREDKTITWDQFK